MSNKQTDWTLSENFQIKRWEYCDCDCHTREGIMHFVACCSGTCPSCKRGISGDVDTHIAVCHPEFFFNRKKFKKYKQGLYAGIV